MEVSAKTVSNVAVAVHVVVGVVRRTEETNDSYGNEDIAPVAVVAVSVPRNPRRMLPCGKI